MKGGKLMLLESFGIEMEMSQTQLLLGLVLGAIFGVAAQISRFCLRRAVAGAPQEQGSARGVWLIALFFAILSFQALSAFGLVELGDHRFLSTSIPLAAITLGGLAFGAGMVLTRGCISRLTILGASGNLRALTVIAVFAITAHATLKGVFSDLRTSLGSATVEAPAATLGELLGSAEIAAALVLGATALIIWRLRPSLSLGIFAALIGVTAALGWSATSVLFLDDFDPAPVQSLSFTLPWSEGLFWIVASSSIPARFGVGLVGGVLAGAFVAALLRGEFKWQSFESPAQTGRYIAGGVLMGFGGVLAGGCTLGAGLSGTATLSFAAIAALVSIIAGAVMTRSLLDRSWSSALPRSKQAASA